MSVEATHKFAFGENWKNFSRTVSDKTVNQATIDLERVLSGVPVEGKRFLDIGCGSGLHALAAIQLGASEVTAFDIDPESVQTTQKMLAIHAPDFRATIQEKSILETPLDDDFYDIVYSWGVLHHTGKMWKAIENAAQFVAPEGHFIISIYKKTPSCRFWKIEKAFYSRLPSLIRFPITSIFSGLYLAGILLSGRNPVQYLKSYHSYRGMNFWHDMIDWLGGYPYESATPEEIKEFFYNMGFECTAEYNTGPVKAGGLFGSGCAEYVFKRHP